MIENANQLKVGDVFIEDDFPEVWEVTKADVRKHNIIGVNAKVIGVRTRELKTNRIGEECWWGSLRDFTQCLIMWSKDKTY